MILAAWAVKLHDVKLKIAIKEIERTNLFLVSGYQIRSTIRIVSRATENPRRYPGFVYS